MANVLSVPLFSRFKDTQVVRLSDGSTLYGLFNIPAEIAEAIDNPIKAVRVTDGQQGRLDMLAYESYSSESAHWVLALANGLIDPIEDMKGLSKVQVPASGSVVDYLARGPQQ